MFACRNPVAAAGVLLAAGAGTRYRDAESACRTRGVAAVARSTHLPTADVTTSWWCWAPRWSRCPPPARAVVAERLGRRDERVAAGRAGRRRTARGRGGAAPRRHPRRRRRRGRAGCWPPPTVARRGWRGPPTAARPGHPGRHRARTGPRWWTRCTATRVPGTSSRPTRRRRRRRVRRPGDRGRYRHPRGEQWCEDNGYEVGGRGPCRSTWSTRSGPANSPARQVDTRRFSTSEA